MDKKIEFLECQKIRLNSLKDTIVLSFSNKRGDVAEKTRRLIRVEKELAEIEVLLKVREKTCIAHYLKNVYVETESETLYQESLLKYQESGEPYKVQSTKKKISDLLEKLEKIKELSV